MARQVSVEETRSRGAPVRRAHCLRVSSGRKEPRASVLDSSVRGGLLAETIDYTCLFMWRARWSLREKHRSQCRHLNGFAPVCLR
ncbi:hypothetical protein WN55_09699 [Dufourea novaeangliae]|uniref:Uncharacterized protein n=1 Tax=Dufourea novaeangliae TaxID=178035 RepID=A0A154P191_DUFNO|nr:hypothetical protein WN55_09699 [Dufourea novaeangliae]